MIPRTLFLTFLDSIAPRPSFKPGPFSAIQTTIFPTSNSAFGVPTPLPLLDLEVGDNRMANLKSNPTVIDNNNTIEIEGQAGRG